MKHSLKSFSWAAPALLALACAAPSAFATSAVGGINGFNDPGGITLNANPADGFGGGARAHGVPFINGNTLQLTSTQGALFTYDSQGDQAFDGGEATSAFFNTKQDITHFSAAFVYQYHGTNPQSIGPADGFTFVLQNAFLGTTALGFGGSDLGYGGPPPGQGSSQGTISPSVALEFNIYNGHTIGTALESNGVTAAEQGDIYHSIAPVNLLSGDPIAVSVIYDGVTMTETLTDQTTGDTHTDRYTINIPQIVNPSGLGFVGFTGGTGSGVANQTISSFVFNNNVAQKMPVTKPNLTLTYQNQSVNGLTAVITNSGSEVDQFQITSATLSNSTTTAPTSTPLPTTPNIIGMGGSQHTTLMFNVPPGTYLLRVQGVYIDHATGQKGTFTGSARNVVIAPTS